MALASTHAMSLEVAGDDVPNEDLDLLRVEVHARMSRLTEATLTVRTEVDGGLAPEQIDALLGASVGFSYGTEIESFSYGFVRAVTREASSAPTPSYYKLHVVPRMWMHTQVRHTRVFQDASVDEIVKLVLEADGEGLVDSDDFKLVLDPSACPVWSEQAYPKLEYVVQYDETDFDFINRLMEHWGLFYFIQSGPGVEFLTIADHHDVFTAHPHHGSLEYVTRDLGERPGVTDLVEHTAIQIAQTVVRDFNWRTPSVPIWADATADDIAGFGYLDHFGEHVRDDAQAGLLAHVRAEAELCQRKVFTGTTNAVGLEVGDRFSITGHPQGLDGDYVLLETTTVVQAEDVDQNGTPFETRFKAILAGTPYRAPRITEKPKIHGIVNAKIDEASDSTAAPIDGKGRYRCLFPFDVAGNEGGRASRYVRCAQPSAGPGYGQHFPLHVGTEVAIAHINGDPDRPIILGAIPNAETTSPVSSANPTHSTIRSRSGMLIEMNDDATD